MLHRIQNSWVCIFPIFYDFISILQVHCLMRPGRQDLNVIFLHLGPVAHPVGDRHPVAHFLKFSYSTYIFEILFFLNIKMKKTQPGRRFASRSPTDWSWLRSWSLANGALSATRRLGMWRVMATGLWQRGPQIWPCRGFYFNFIWSNWPTVVTSLLRFAFGFINLVTQ